MRQIIKKVIREVLNESSLIHLKNTLIKYRDKYGRKCKTTPQGLNSGYCEDIAYDVIEELGGETSTTYLIDDGFFWIFHPDEDEEVSDYRTESGEYWNIDNFKKYGEPPFSYDDLDKLDLNGHVWIYSNGKHYDVEAIHGVDNFWDLPLYQRQLSGLNLVEKED